MSSPRTRNSKLLEDLRKARDPKQSDRIRTSMIIAARIATALSEKGWNKHRLATELNKSPSLITRWLSGNHNFTTETLREIEAVLDYPLLNLELPTVTAQPCAIVPQHSFMTIGEALESFSKFTDNEEIQLAAIRIRPGTYTCKLTVLAPN